MRLKVLVDLPRHSPLDPLLDYLAPEPWPAGTLVRVPLGRREVCGIVWGPGDEAACPDGEGAAVALREIAQVLDALPPLGEAWRRLAAFAAGYYQRSLGEVALNALPPDLRELDATQLARRLRRGVRQSIARHGLADGKLQIRIALESELLRKLHHARLRNPQRIGELLRRVVAQ